MKRNAVVVFCILMVLVAILAGCSSNNSATSEELSVAAITPAAEKFRTATTHKEKECVYNQKEDVTVVCLESGKQYHVQGRNESDEPVDYTMDKNGLVRTRCMSNPYIKVYGIRGADFPKSGSIGIAWKDDPQNEGAAGLTRYSLYSIKNVGEDYLEATADIGLWVRDGDEPVIELRKHVGSFTDDTYQGFYMYKGRENVTRVENLEQAVEVLFDQREFGIILSKPQLGDIAYARTQRYAKGRLPLQKWPGKILLADGRVIYRFTSNHEGEMVTHFGHSYKTPAWSGVVCTVDGATSTNLQMKFVGYCPEGEQYYNRFFSGKPMYFDPKTNERI